MADTIQIPRERLAEYFDALTKRLIRDPAPDGVEAEIVALEIGHQDVVQGARLEGIVYDSRADSLEIALDVGDHRVLQPREVWVTEEADGIPSTIEIVHQDGSRELVLVKRVVSRRLPPSTSA